MSTGGQTSPAEAAQGDSGESRPRLASIQVAEHKPRAAASYRRETKVLENAIQTNGMHYVATVDGIIAAHGGISLVVGGKVIGASGCSGGAGSQDEVACKVAATTVKQACYYW